MELLGEMVHQEETEWMENKGTKEIPGHKATSVCRAHQELMGEMVHQEEME